MKFVDYHLHSNFSKDNKLELESVVKKAEELGLREICFTQHYEPSSVGKEFDISMPADRIPEYVGQVEALRKKYKIPIKLGLEVEYEKAFESEIRKTLANYPFDFVLGSVHTLDGFPINQEQYLSKFLKEKTKTGSIDEFLNFYFTKLHELIDSKLFDVISHADIFKVKWERAYGTQIKFDSYREHSKEVIKLLKKKDVGFEINTGGFRYSCVEQCPAKDFIKMAYEEGIKKVTIGSDAHMLEHVAKDLDKVLGLMKEIGYTEVAVFNKRKVLYIPISELEK